jgi:glucosamine--fructose-6-phosphate aminotransferase (isomerizing)
MCGIFGVVGSNEAKKEVLDGLKRLDYRGYDSWGVGVIEGNKIKVFKAVGEVVASKGFEKLSKGKVAIGHTRWATHGSVTVTNAHPHYASDESFVLAHNGIVENYLSLKDGLLKKGSKFVTQTDTEVIVRLVENFKKKGKSLREVVRFAFKKLKGRNTIIVLSTEGELVAARNGSPLVIGLTKDKTYFSSDTLSFAPVAEDMVVVENGQVVNLKDGRLRIMDLRSGKAVKVSPKPIGFGVSKINKEGFEHYMAKEIHETPTVLKQLTASHKKQIERLARAIRKAKNVYTIGSGTTGLAASQIAYYLREFGRVKAVELIGAETGSYHNLWGKGDLIIAPSQSGETADVLEALEEAKRRGVKIASYVNMVGSMMTRMSDYRFMAQAGPEICVMSTKIFSSQTAWGYLVAKTVSGKFKEGIKNIDFAAGKIEKYLESKKNHKQLISLARKLISKKDIFLLGKGESLNMVKEGMVKIIEGTYKHAHAIAAGDLKHYAITIMEKGVPVIVLMPDDKVKSDVLNAVSEVKARGAMVVGLSPERHEQFDEYINIPKLKEINGPAGVVPLQLLAYYMTVELGLNVDKPRNIAKSVTVK